MLFVSDLVICLLMLLKPCALMREQSTSMYFTVLLYLGSTIHADWVVQPLGHDVI